MEHIYGLDSLLKFFRSKGLTLSRATFYQSHFDELKKYGYAKEVAPRRWVFFQPEMTHWAEYVLEARKRIATRRVPANYKYNEGDCVLFKDGNIWDDAPQPVDAS